MSLRVRKKSEFMALAHEMGQPLTPISLFGFCTLLFAGNGTVFYDSDEFDGYDYVCLRDGFSSPTSVFYQDPYLDEGEEIQ